MKNTTISLSGNSFPIVVDERGSRRIHICSQMRTRLGADSPKVIVFNMGESLLWKYQLNSNTYLLYESKRLYVYLIGVQENTTKPTLTEMRRWKTTV